MPILGCVRWFRRAAVLLSVALALAGAAGAQGEPPPEDAAARMRQTLAEHAEQIRQARAQLAQRPGDAGLWRNLAEMERWQAQMEARLAMSEGATVNPADSSRAAVERVCQEWMRAAPEDAGPWLLLAQWQPTPQEKSAMVAAAAERFPRSAEAVEALSADLRGRGEMDARSRLLEDFLARNPDNPDAYRLLLGNYSGQGNAARAKEVLERWYTQFPEDARAASSWLGAVLPDKDPDEARRLVAEALPRIAKSPEAESVCQLLESAAAGQLLPQAAECYARVLAGGTGDTAHLAQGYARVAARLGDPERVDAALSSLPPTEKTIALLSVGSSLASAGRCDEAIRILRDVKRFPAHSAAGSVTSSLRVCAGSPAAQQLYLERLATAPPDEMPGMVLTGEKLAPPEQVEPVLLARLRESPSTWELQEAADQLYTKAGWTDKRIAHLTSWIRIDPAASRGMKRQMDLAGLLAQAGREEEAIAVLETAARSEGGAHDRLVLGRLVSLLLDADRIDEAAGLAGRLAGSADAAEAAWGSLFQARIAVVRGHQAEALAGFRRFFDAMPAEEEGYEEYMDLLAATHRETEIPRFLERRFDAQAATGQPIGNRDERVAEKLHDLGMHLESLAYLERALAKAPDNAELLHKIARTAQDANRPERAEEAIRKLLALAPQTSSSWLNLADFQRRSGQPDRAIATVQEGVRVTGKESPDLQFELAECWLDKKQPDRALPLLRQLSEKSPGNKEIREELDRAVQMQSGGGSGEL
jgi:tetratricopeptide (TPR) repeat protein